MNFTLPLQKKLISFTNQKEYFTDTQNIWMTVNMQNGSDSSHDNIIDRKQRTVRFNVTNERKTIDQSDVDGHRRHPRRFFQNQVQQTSLEENNTNVAMLDRNERDRKPRSNGRYFNKQRSQQYSPTSTDTGLSGSPPYVNGINGSRTNLTNSYKPSYSPTSTDAESVSPLPSNGWDFSELEMRYTSMINSLKDELSFLEESNTNLLTELRESQNSNYVLTEEIRRQQRNNLSTLDELQACQTANSVLRQELQRLEQSSVKMSRDSEKYKKANSMLKDEIKDLKAHNYKRKNSMVTLKEKAIDLQNDILEKEKDFKDLSSLKQTVNIIVEAVENDSNIDNGYFPTDSDISSNDGNDDKQLGAFTPKPVKVLERSTLLLPSKEPLSSNISSSAYV